MRSVATHEVTKDADSGLKTWRFWLARSRTRHDGLHAVLIGNMMRRCRQVDGDERL